MSENNPLVRHIVDYQSPLYHQLVDLRYRVLRKPLGMQFTEEQLKKEGAYLHLALVKNNLPVATLQLLSPERPDHMQMKQVAVDPALQGKGIGAELIRFAEDEAKSRGVHLMFCHARETAVPFYLRQGYTIMGDMFSEIGIPHYYMEKSL
jgi:GNAT superfamily N-acetyltransferase